MPTFNQLVRKGRQQVTYKSTSPAMQKGLNTLKNVETNNPNNYDEEWEYPLFEEEATITVYDLLPEETPEETYKAIVDYDDPRWEEIIMALDGAVSLEVYNQAAYQTKEMPEVGMPATLQADGPSGFTCFLNAERISGTNQYCSEPVFASTWNIELIEELGKAIMLPREQLPQMPQTIPELPKLQIKPIEPQMQVQAQQPVVPSSQF